MKPPRLARPRVSRPAKADWRQARGGHAFRAGHAAEWLAAAWLVLKGYRILGFRLKAPGAEIDILAQKSGVLAVVEVKRRATAEAAETALAPAQRERLRLAGERLLRQRPGLKGLRLRLDTVTLASRAFPRHRRGL
jgi:putative endonuclease